MTAVEVRVHRMGWCALAAVLALASCGGVRAQATPTIEYMTPVEATHGGLDDSPVAASRMAVALQDPTPRPPACSVGCESPTKAPTSETTAMPQVVIPTATFQPSSQSVESISSLTPESRNAYAGQCGPYDATVTRWWPVIVQYPWDACTAMYVISAESDGLNVYNYAGSGACGVMQIDPCQYPYDGVSNIAVGYAKYVAAGGWSPWEVIG